MKPHPPRSAGQYNRANLSAQQRAPLTQYDIRSGLFEGFRREWRGSKASKSSALSVCRAAPEPHRSEDGVGTPRQQSHLDELTLPACLGDSTNVRCHDAATPAHRK